MGIGDIKGPCARCGKYDSDAPIPDPPFNTPFFCGFCWENVVTPSLEHMRDRQGHTLESAFLLVWSIRTRSLPISP